MVQEQTIIQQTNNSNENIEVQEASITQESNNSNENIENILTLPDYRPMSTSGFMWSSRNGDDFENNLEKAYKEIIYWKSNPFSLPNGSSGTDFIDELSRLLKSYADQSPLERVAMKCIFFMQKVILQKPYYKSKNKHHVTCLKRRMISWKEGDLDELMKEGRCIQKQLNQKISRKSDKPNKPYTFRKHVNNGRIKQAIRTITDTKSRGILKLDEKIKNKTVKQILKDKHPSGKPATNEALIEPNNEPPTDSTFYFEQLDAELIKKIILKTNGSAGPSGIDANAWRIFSTCYQQNSINLCNEIASVARRIATSHVDPQSLQALSISRLVPLDKNPGVRPIGISETLRRIISKSIQHISSTEIKSVIGLQQLCTGQQSGCEAAVHAMNALYDRQETQGILLVDANNAFNALNRNTYLQNINILCPTISPTILNFYREETELIVDNHKIRSSEGTTQGDPLAMIVYALGTLPLIEKTNQDRIHQIWYADDAGAAGSISDLRTWWDKLSEIGPSYGYFANNLKTCLIVKPEILQTAKNIFKNTGITIKTDGKEYLGSCLGCKSFHETFCLNKSAEWKKEIENLSTIAKCHPQSAYTVFTKALLSRWSYLLRTVNELEKFLQPVEDAIHQQFIPALTGRSLPSETEREIFALPIRSGGLGIPNPTKMKHNYNDSKTITNPIIQILTSKDNLNPDLAQIQSEQYEIIHKIKDEKKYRSTQHFNDIYNCLPENLKRTIDLAKEKGASSWLSTIPLIEHGFQLNKSAFRDALCLRYGWTPTNIPLHCACGQKFSVSHVLSCPTGGFPTIRHNEIRDIMAQHLTEVSHAVELEPSLQPVTGESFRLASTTTDDLAKADIAANGFFGGRYERAFFDIRICNPHAPSYRTQSLAKIFRKHELEKKRKYESRIREIENASFVPIVMSCTGGCGPISTNVIKRLSSMLADKQKCEYNTMITWIRCQLAFAIIRSSIMCIRGARSSTRKFVSRSNEVERISMEAKIS